MTLNEYFNTNLPDIRLRYAQLHHEGKEVLGLVVSSNFEIKQTLHLLLRKRINQTHLGTVFGLKLYISRKVKTHLFIIKPTQ